MKRPTYIGTHRSTMNGGNVTIPYKTLDQILSREGRIPDHFLGFAVKEGAFPHIYLLHTEDYQEQKEHIKTIRAKYIPDKFEVRVRNNKRLVIPIELRNFVELYKGVYFIGNLDHFEIWSSTNATKYGKASDAFMAQHQRTVENLHNILGL